MSSLVSPVATQPLTHRPYSDEDERNDAVSVQESARLLDVEGDQPAYASPESKTVLRATWILTSLTLCLSILSVLLLIANKILVESQHYPGYGYEDYEFYWPTRAGSRAVGITVYPSTQSMARSTY